MCCTAVVQKAHPDCPAKQPKPSTAVFASLMCPFWQASLRIGRTTGDFCVTLQALEKAILEPTTDDLMDVIISRLLLTRQQAVFLPPEKGMGYDWWQPALKARVQNWYAKRDELQAEIDRRLFGDEDKDQAENAAATTEATEVEEVDTGTGAAAVPSGVVSSDAASLAAVPSVPGLVVTNVDLGDTGIGGKEQWRSGIGKGFRCYGQDSVGDWWKCNVVDVRDSRRGNEVLLHYHGWKRSYDEWVSVLSSRLSSLDLPKPRRVGQPEPEAPSPSAQGHEWKCEEKIVMIYSDPNDDSKIQSWPGEISAIDVTTGDLSVQFPSGECESGIKADDADLFPRRPVLNVQWRIGLPVTMRFEFFDDRYAAGCGPLHDYHGVVTAVDEGDGDKGTEAEGEEGSAEAATSAVVGCSHRQKTFSISFSDGSVETGIEFNTDDVRPKDFSGRDEEMAYGHEEDGSLLVESHPVHEFNGIYWKSKEEHEGCARYSNVHGKHMFHYPLYGQWYLASSFQPEVEACNAYIATKGTKLPLGSQTWQVCNVGGTAKLDEEVWAAYKLTITDIDVELADSDASSESEEEEEEEEEDEAVEDSLMVSPRIDPNELNIKEWSEQKLEDQHRMYSELIKPSCGG